MTPQEIKDIRLKLGLTQEKLAQFMNVSFQTINRWERGWFQPSPMAIEKLRIIAERVKTHE